MKVAGLALLSGTSLFFFQNCGQPSSGATNAGSILNGNAVYPTNSTSPFSMTQTLTSGGTSQPVPLFPSFGNFYVNSTPSTGGIPAGEPWAEFVITFSQCYPQGGRQCSLLGVVDPGSFPVVPGRIYIQVFCHGHINDPASCEKALSRVDLANLSSDISVSFEMDYAPFSNGMVQSFPKALSGILQIQRSSDTPRAIYTTASGLVDDGSKFDVILTNLNFSNTTPPSSQISIPTFEGEFRGYRQMNILWQ